MRRYVHSGAERRLPIGERRGVGQGQRGPVVPDHGKFGLRQSTVVPRRMKIGRPSGNGKGPIQCCIVKVARGCSPRQEEVIGSHGGAVGPLDAAVDGVFDGLKQYFNDASEKGFIDPTMKKRILIEDSVALFFKKFKFNN